MERERERESMLRKVMRNTIMFRIFHSLSTKILEYEFSC